ncbi:UMP kinase [Brevibacillus nitrificans]|jgi:uridylate kinase|uniref:Uridylate kinase n=1 Tax=Brevibacillus nitrificans TaxID=651560 RepID=A0A3M8DHA8_9BACL|nr:MULTISPECIES: UMP kinase [Brevibacillus]MEC2128081.1 UMP kinase [Brevibacillus centrosporus]MED1791823.1 UMP kinase [Brevibacillus nitrificans]MED1952955.1 UMP kinase [Brevibacillus centrosporus]RNB67554.1 UMP kinase [Brevibacillus centrosporus]RNB86745.1 UMP kinase [Brevibacillus nitrificans]
MRYKRVLVKLSGGAVAGDNGFGFDPEQLENIAGEILALLDMGVEVAIVIGGGNIFRGNMADQWGIERVEADNIGTLATVINSLMLRGVLKARVNREVRVMTAVPINAVAEPYIRLRAVHHLEKGYVVIFAGGNGQPYVTTDYPAVQRALEVEADAILVAKHGVDGVFTADPRKDAEAKQYQALSCDEVIRKDLKVMDQSAMILARDHGLPLHVFNFDQPGAMARICQGEQIGTYIARDVEAVLK